MKYCLTLSCSPPDFTKFLSPLLPECLCASLRCMWAVNYVRLFFLSLNVCVSYFVFLLEKADGKIYALYLKLNVLTFTVTLGDFRCHDCLRLSFKEVLAQTSFASFSKSPAPLGEQHCCQAGITFLSEVHAEQTPQMKSICPGLTLYIPLNWDAVNEDFLSSLCRCAISQQCHLWCGSRFSCTSCLCYQLKLGRNISCRDFLIT